MLVLTRKVNEVIMIGDQIEIVVVGIKGDKVQLGIQAPANFTILRKELYDQVVEQNVAAQDVDLKRIQEINNKLKESK